MSVNITSKLSIKCQNCPFFEAVTLTEMINHDCKRVPDFKVTIDCKHHSGICDGLELMFHDQTDTEPPRKNCDKQTCGRCGTTFFYEKKQNEAMCPVCGTRYLLL